MSSSSLSQQPEGRRELSSVSDTITNFGFKGRMERKEHWKLGVSATLPIAVSPSWQGAHGGRSLRQLVTSHQDPS